MRPCKRAMPWLCAVHDGKHLKLDACLLRALFGLHAVSALSPGCAAKRTNTRPRRSRLMRGRAIFCNGLKVICPVQPRFQKLFASHLTQIISSSLTIPSRKRGVGHRHERWDGSGGRGSVVARGDRRASFACERSNGAQTNGAASGRQSRVVLAPVAGVKLAEAKRTQPGFDAPLIRRRR
jgi:hypothetical protein